MRLNPVAATLVAFGLATAGSAFADNVSTQISNLQAQINQLQAQVNATGSTPASSGMGNMVGVNDDLSYQMLNNFNGTNREMYLLKARQNNALPLLTLGGQVEGDAIYQHTNNDGIFYNPIGNGTTSDQFNQLALTSADLTATAAINSWATAYIQVGKDDIGQSNVDTNFGIEQAYLLLGNLNAAPVYGFFGRKAIDFGSFATVDMYNQPLTRSMFMATGNTAGIGYTGYGFTATASLMNGGNTTDNVANVSSANQYENLYTSSNSNINNFAVNLSYNFDNMFNIGLGYLNGSSFYTATNTNGAATNGAFDVNAALHISGFDVLGEYVTTINDFDDTSNSSSPYTHLVQVWSLGADYNLPQLAGMNNVISAEYSQAYVGSGSANQATQYVVGYRIQPIQHVWTGLEYAYDKGGAGFFVGVPSGYASFVPFAASVTGNGQTVTNNSVVLDVTATF